MSPVKREVSTPPRVNVPPGFVSLCDSTLSLFLYPQSV
jgi:hypothetical protein